MKVYVKGGGATLDTVGADITIAASDSINKEESNYICTGTNDEGIINQAIQDLGVNGGKILLRAGMYNAGSALTITKDNVTLEGMGFATRLNQLEINLDAIGCSVRKLSLVKITTAGTGCVIDSVKADDRFVISGNNNAMINCEAGEGTDHSVAISGQNCLMSGCQQRGLNLNGIGCIVANNYISENITMGFGHDNIITGNKVGNKVLLGSGNHHNLLGDNVINELSFDASTYDNTANNNVVATLLVNGTNNRIGGKPTLLWEGSWNSGDITVPGFLNYTAYHVVLTGYVSVYAYRTSTSFRGGSGTGTNTPRFHTSHLFADYLNEALTFGSAGTVVHNSGGNHSAYVQQAVTAIYGLM